MDVVLIVLALAVGIALGIAIMAKKITAGTKQTADLNTQLAVATRYSSSLQEQLDTTLNKIDGMSAELAQYRDKSVALDAQKQALEQRIREQSEVLKVEFKNTANTLFEDISKKFSTNSEKQIGDLLNPLRERLGEFQKMVGESFSIQGKEQHTLKAEIERIVNMNEAMRLETSNLTKALRGDVKAQGNWGEVILERILEESGLRRDEDYILQGVDMGLTNQDGGRQQPDVIVKLPDNKHIIVDAKVSLVAYERFCSSEGDERAAHLKDFLKSVKAHVNGLESKKYQDNEKLGTPDFVMMFMPVEGAYSLAVQSDSELHSYAWGKKIVLVCPATLFATLRTVASLWNIERQNKNALEIARQGGVLFDKFAGFVEDMDKIGSRLGLLQQSYDGAMNKLSQGRGNLVSGMEKLRQLGVKPSKSLPKTLEAVSAEDDEESLSQVAEG